MQKRHVFIMMMVIVCISVLCSGMGLATASAQDQPEARPTMKILAIGKVLEGATEDNIGALVKDEAKRAWELYMAGIFREIYFRTDAPLPVVIMECKDIEEAKTIISTLPMVKAGLTDFDLMPLGPFYAFGALFAQE